jgi:hypothetical protein
MQHFKIVQETVVLYTEYQKYLSYKKLSLKLMDNSSS